MSLIQLDWIQYKGLIKEITAYLALQQFAPEVVIGIARGGLTPMVTLSNYYHTRQTGVVFVQKTANDDKFAEMLPEAVCFGYGIPFPLEGRNVLLVDNVIQSGQTIRAGLKILKDLGASNTQVVSLYIHRQTYEFSPYSPVSVESDAWIVFPWDEV